VAQVSGKRGSGRVAGDRLARRRAGRTLIPESVHVFILPPSLESLKERLVRRGQDDAATIARRLIAAREEIGHYVDFNYVIINQEFASAVDDLSAVVRATRLHAQQLVRHQPLIAQLIA
jgi:guanylate kinase